MSTTHGFTLVRDEAVAEIGARARLYRHDRTGAELLSVECADENKVFGIAFRTPPADSTGIAHILEHSVLCGSRRYPTREPFVELLKGSLQTFLNAFTFPDKTVYPLASQNAQDFYNLIDVYLDAVFQPLLTPSTFDQEAWHAELEQPGATPAFKGVVFNEMKGVYSSPDDLLALRVQRALFPATAYGLDYGGDPRHIPDLTHAQLLQFHRDDYHPANARIWFYGDDDPAERLRRLGAWLQDADRRDVRAEVPLQPRFPAPVAVTQTYQPGAGEAAPKAQLVLAWLLGESADAATALALRTLAHILIGTPAAPLRQALIESGLGEDLAGGGLEGDLRQLYFAAGLKGVAPDRLDQVEALILDTLRRLAADGLDRRTVAASLNTVEFQLRENNTGSFPRGLSLYLRALTTWLHGGDPLAPLRFEAPLAALQAGVAAGQPVFEDLLRHHLLDNPHRVAVRLLPDAGHAARDEAAEREQLQRLQAGLDEAAAQALIDNTRELKRRQVTPDSPEALATIPSLALSDLPARIRTIPQAEPQPGLLVHDLFTSGIVYLDVGFNLSLLPPDLLPYAPLLGRALLEMGTEEEDYVAISQRIGTHTGGIRPQLLTSAVRASPDAALWLLLRGKALAGRGAELLGILEDILLRPRLDHRERFRQIVLREKATLEADLLPSGHRYVLTRLRAHFHAADLAAELTQGLSHFSLRDLARRLDEDWPGVLADLRRVHGLLANRDALLLNVTTDHAAWHAFQPRLREWQEALPAAALARHPLPPAAWPTREGFALPAQVNYVGRAANLHALNFAFDGAWLAISKYLRTAWLWERVRVQGGAYGGFCSLDHRTGVFCYASYRDPNLEATLDIYDATGGWLRGLELDADELRKSIIGAIGELDAYQLPDAKGLTALVRHLAGDTDAWRQAVRDQLLSATAADFHHFGEALDAMRGAAVTVVLGSPERLAAAGGFKVTTLL